MDPTSSEIWALTAPVLAVLTVVLSIIGIAVYIYSAWAIMNIAQKTKTPHAWLAWIPIANIYLLTQIAKLPWWWFLIIIGLYLLNFIPIIGFLFSLAALGIITWWWWKISENRGKPGWWGIMVGLIPIVNIVFLGLIAWTVDEKISTNK